MPYVTKKAKERLALGLIPSNAGELNYKITEMLIDYLDAQGPDYQHINACVVCSRSS